MTSSDKRLVLTCYITYYILRKVNINFNFIIFDFVFLAAGSVYIRHR